MSICIKKIYFPINIHLRVGLWQMSNGEKSLVLACWSQLFSANNFSNNFFCQYLHVFLDICNLKCSFLIFYFTKLVNVLLILACLEDNSVFLILCKSYAQNKVEGLSVKDLDYKN